MDNPLKIAYAAAPVRATCGDNASAAALDECHHPRKIRTPGRACFTACDQPPVGCRRTITAGSTSHSASRRASLSIHA